MDLGEVGVSGRSGGRETINRMQYIILENKGKIIECGLKIYLSEWSLCPVLSLLR